jgi:hypothetical protein
VLQATILPIFGSIRLYTTTCGMLYPIHCQSVISSPDHQPATYWVECIWNVMVHVQKPDFVFRRNRWVHLNQRWHQFSWLLAAEVCASVVVMLDTPCSKVVKGTGYPLHSLLSPSLPLPVLSGFNWTLQHTTSCCVQSNAPEDGQNWCRKLVELIWIHQQTVTVASSWLSSSHHYCTNLVQRN